MFIRKNNILFANQFSFVKNSSTGNAIFALKNRIVQAMDKGDSTAGIFFDLQKAFNMVFHEKVTENLELISGERCGPKGDFALI